MNVAEKVIVLDETSTDATEMPSNESISKADFFNCAGIWENRDDINQESIRAKAWRDNQR